MFTSVCHSVLMQMNRVHILTPYFFNINFNIFLLFTSRSLQVFWLKFCMHFSSPHASYMASPSPWFHHPINIWWREQIIKFITQLSPSSCYFLCPLCPNIFLSTLYINTNSHSSLTWQSSNENVPNICIKLMNKTTSVTGIFITLNAHIFRLKHPLSRYLRS